MSLIISVFIPIISCVRFLFAILVRLIYDVYQLVSVSACVVSSSCGCFAPACCPGFFLPVHLINGALQCIKGLYNRNHSITTQKEEKT